MTPASQRPTVAAVSARTTRRTGSGRPSSSTSPLATSMTRLTTRGLTSMPPLAMRRHRGGRPAGRWRSRRGRSSRWRPRCRSGTAAAGRGARRGGRCRSARRSRRLRARRAAPLVRAGRRSGRRRRWRRGRGSWRARPSPGSAWSWMTWAPMASSPLPQSMASLALSTPRSSAPAMAKVLKVEPGSQVSVTARFFSTSPGRGALGLKVGQVASARSSPVAGSSAMAMPERAWEPVTARESACSVASCSPWSMVSSTRAPSRVRPGSGASRRTVLPAPSRSEGTRDGSPRSSSSNARSSPSSPLPSSPTKPRRLAAKRALGVVALASPPRARRPGRRASGPRPPRRARRAA